MKVGIISDTHDHCDNIDRFVRLYEERAIDRLIHLGDIVAPFAARRFAALAQRIPFLALYGNNDGERAGLKNIIAEWGEIVDGPRRVEAGGRVLVVHHYPMTAAEVRAAFPDCEFYFSGHTHEWVEEWPEEGEQGPALINPGEACGWVTGLSTAGILDTDTGTYETLRLE